MLNLILIFAIYFSGELYVKKFCRILSLSSIETALHLFTSKLHRHKVKLAQLWWVVLRTCLVTQISFYLLRL